MAPTQPLKRHSPNSALLQQTKSRKIQIFREQPIDKIKGFLDLIKDSNSWSVMCLPCTTVLWDLPEWMSKWASCAWLLHSCTPGAWVWCWHQPDTCCHRHQWSDSAPPGEAAGNWCSIHSAGKQAGGTCVRSAWRWLTCAVNTDKSHYGDRGKS